MYARVFLSLVKAIHAILKKQPALRFRFIGSDAQMPGGGGMRAHIENSLAAYKKTLSLRGL